MSVLALSVSLVLTSTGSNRINLWNNLYTIHYAWIITHNPIVAEEEKQSQKLWMVIRARFVSRALENNRIERFIESIVAYWTNSSFSRCFIAFRLPRTLVAIPTIRSSRNIIESCEEKKTWIFVPINVSIKRKRFWYIFIKLEMDDKILTEYFSNL